jgi:predicted esterase
LGQVGGVLRRVCSPLAWLGVTLCVGSSALEAKAAERAWCAPEVETLSDGVCFYGPEKAAHAEHPVLVLFLHSLVAINSDWQWEQQRTLVSAAERHGFSVLMPRGRVGLGPRRAGDVWAWPTSPAKQAEVETELVAEWLAARQQIEARNGRPFERLLVFGFSNGAYYASTLALRNRLPADGYGVFAGGSGGKFASVLGSRTTQRAPIFIGYGTKDPAWHDMASLADTLKKLGWRHQVKTEPVGHLVTEAQLAAAMRFLSAHGHSATDGAK